MLESPPPLPVLAETPACRNAGLHETQTMADIGPIRDHLQQFHQSQEFAHLRLPRQCRNDV